jgi:hypothetical protein
MNMRINEWENSKKTIAEVKQLEEDGSITIGEGETLV